MVYVMTLLTTLEGMITAGSIPEQSAPVGPQPVTDGSYYIDDCLVSCWLCLHIGKFATA